jgi:glyoxylase-like metal-dependent hydrolase (beta-lactamase superfamily II)
LTPLSFFSIVARMTTTFLPRGLLLCLVCSGIPAIGEVDKVEKVAPDVYFHEGNMGRGHCNNGWVVFEDYVLVIDANFPSGAQLIIPKIREITSKPIRFAFDTHHHGDHAYGNQVWVDAGAVPVAHTGVVEEMKKYEPGRWEDTAKGRHDVAVSKLKLPSLLFHKDMIFDDGQHRVELLHFGVAHTHGDGFAWLPKEKILFTGDACVNGPFNYIGDGDTEQWIKTLEAARQLGATTICPGHGPMANGSLLEDQQTFFVELRKEVKRLVDAGKSPEEVKAAVDQIGDTLKKNRRIERFAGSFMAGQVEKVYREMGGKPFPTTEANAGRGSLEKDRDAHAKEHGKELVGEVRAGR